MPIPYSGNPMGHTRERLPRGYRRVEYLESTGTQWINTGLILPSHPLIKTTVSFKGITPLHNYNSIFGGGPGYKGTSDFHLAYCITTFVVAAKNEFLAFAAGAYDKRPATGSLADVDYVNISMTVHTTTVNAVSVDMGKTSLALGTRNLYIFRSSSLDANLSPCSAFKMYSFKLIDETNNNILINFVPALDPAGRPCMYDLVEQKPYYNAAASGPDFLWGGDPEVELPAGYRRCTYLESTGAQWIDTGFKPGSSTVIEGKTTFMDMAGAAFGVYDAGAAGNTAVLYISSLPDRYLYATDQNRTRIHLAYNVNTPFTAVYLYDIGAGKYLLNGNTVQFSAKNNWTSTVNMPIFCRWLNGYGYNSKSKIYYFNMLDEGKLERYLVPCLSTDNTPCMVDTVTGTVYNNQGEGTFLWG